MRRAEYYHESGAPMANTVVACVFGFVRDESGRVLLIRRADTGNWELPGGGVEPGESGADALAREVSEETGIMVEIVRLSGVYSDPGHVIAYPEGEVRQQFAVCFHSREVGGRLRPDRVEADAVAWVAVDELDALPIHPSVRHRIADALDDAKRLTR